MYGGTKPSHKILFSRNSLYTMCHGWSKGCREDAVAKTRCGDDGKVPGQNDWKVSPYGRDQKRSHTIAVHRWTGAKERAEVSEGSMR